ncbi:MAG TPA: hypothetical protein VJT73_20990 [Polyangiaceae bacterium]|nr:hypothetical protein [Polyangiaceae bacterium]
MGAIGSGFVARALGAALVLVAFTPGRGGTNGRDTLEVANLPPAGDAMQGDGQEPAAEGVAPTAERDGVRSAGGPADAADVVDVPQPGVSTNRIASGTRMCENARDCLGLDCVAGPAKTGTCGVRCAGDGSCEARERCVSGLAFPSVCLRACTSPTHCAFGFDCVDYHNDGLYTCVPAPWAVELPDQ